VVRERRAKEWKWGEKMNRARKSGGMGKGGV
jgi:hypothetical protein